MRYWSEEIKKKARILRKKGFTYSELVKELGASRSTIHWWLRDMKRSSVADFRSREKWMKEIQPLGAMANKRKREERLKELTNKMKREVECLKIDKEVGKIILSMLYWAEGSKGRDVLNMVNTDPKLLSLFITLLRKCYVLDESKFRLRLHLHHYHNEEELKNFWSELLGISKDNFHKSYRKPRNPDRNFRRNFGGICTLRYNSVYLKDEVLFYALAVSDKVLKENGALVV